MANLVKHRFASAKANGPDATQIQPSHWNDGHAFSGGNAGDLLTRDPTDATYGAKWAPPAPALPLTTGQWVAVPFSAGNFYAPGATWNVTGQDLYMYTIIGKTAIVCINTGASNTMSGTPVRLRIKLPVAVVPAGFANAAPCIYYLQGVGTTGTGLVQSGIAVNELDILRDVAGTPFAAVPTYLYITSVITLA